MIRLQVGQVLLSLSWLEDLRPLTLLDGLEAGKSLLHIFVDQETNCHDILVCTILYELEQFWFHFLERLHQIDEHIVLFELISGTRIIKYLITKVDIAFQQIHLLHNFLTLRRQFTHTLVG